MDKLKKLEELLNGLDGMYEDSKKSTLWHSSRDDDYLDKVLKFLEENPNADEQDLAEYEFYELQGLGELLKVVSADSFRRAVANLDEKQKQFIEKHVRKDIFDLNKSEDELEHAFSEVTDIVDSIFQQTEDCSETEKITGDILDIFDNELEDQ